MSANEKYDPPCIGCGFCCFSALCPAATRLYGTGIKICPQLVWSIEDHRYYCGLSSLPGKIGQGYKEELYIGAGCCSNLNSWRLDIKRRDLPTTIENPISPEFQLFLNCLAKEFIASDTYYFILSEFRYQLIHKLNYSEDNAKSFMYYVADLIKNNKKSYIENFMG